MPKASVPEPRRTGGKPARLPWFFQPLGFLFLLIAAGSAPAQEEGSVHFRTLCLRAFADTPTLHYLPAPKQASLEVELPEANLSAKRYQAKLHTIPFYASAPDPAAGKLPEPVAIARIPASIKQAVLLFLPASDGKRYQVIAVDADLLSFRGGDQRFVNLTKVPIGIDLGGTRSAIKSGDSQTFPISGDANDRLALQLFYQQDESWHRFSSTRVTVDPRIRRIILCYYNPAEKRICSRAIWDRVDTPEPGETP